MLSFNQIEPIKRKENYTNFIKTISSPHKTKSENVIGYKEGKNKHIGLSGLGISQYQAT